MSVNKKKAPSSKSSLRRQRKSQSNAALPIAVGALALLMLIVLVANAGGSSTPTNNKVAKNDATTDKAEVVKTEVETKETIASQEAKKPVKVEETQVATSKKGLITYENGGEGSNEAAPTATTENVIVDNRSLQDLKVEINQLTIERKWDEALSLIDNYNGPYAQDMSLLRRKVEHQKNSYQEFAKADNNPAKRPVPAPVNKEVEKKGLQPIKKFIDKKEDGVIGFQPETEADRKKKKKAPSVNLVVHSKIVGLPNNVIVVWKDRSKVLSYSRLIKACENKKSKYYQERVEKAKKYLEDNRNFYELIPFKEAKMTLRTKGFTVSEVFFNQTVKADHYVASETNRYKGYIISYDIKPPSAGGGFGMGC